NAKEEIRVNNLNFKNQLASKNNLQNKSIDDFFKSVRDLKVDEIWHSSIILNNDFGEISKPLKSIIKFVIRTKDAFIIIDLDTKIIFDLLKNSFNEKFYILDKDGNFLLHDKYSWSKYFFPNKTVDILDSKYKKQILNENIFHSNTFITKRFYLSKDSYIILFIYKNEYELSDLFSNLQEYIYSIMIIVLLISLLLSLFLSNPLTKLNTKILDKNKILDLTIKKSSQDLDESLEIIDKHIMLVKMDKNKIITNVSEALCQTSGFTKEEIIGFDYNFLISHNKESKVFELISKKLKDKKSYSKELLHLKKDTSKYWAHVHFETIYNDKKEIIAFHAILDNISDKKLIENLYTDLNYQVGQYNAIFENVNNGIALIDLKGKFLKTNSMFTKYLGYSKDELLNMSCFDLIIKNSSNILKKIILQAKEIGSISQIEKIFIHKDKTKVHLEISLSLLPDKNHFVLVVDSLEDKRKLQELNQNLALKINDEVERSRQKDKIHQEEQIKNTKLSSIGSLAAGITHEINTPLTYIKGNFEMMSYDILDLPQSDIKTRMLEDSEKINDGLNRIANIVESMREISQASNETKENINIYPTFITALTMAYNRSKQITRIYINGNIFKIDNINKNEYEFICNIQKERLVQVWIIIINNALDELIKIQDYEKRALYINIEQKDENIITIFKDNAGGINDDILDNIFDPFVSSKQHSGMGVGLNIAKKIIDQQNGELIAYNEDDGAVFQITLKKV
ncbi:PAS domain-containing sensor histidine kinase, partial [Poseidonibacter sp.]|uniref:PAS domain-containing sensor histidine kinase n=1 Tax=Poseidonibacter sp. TaxID=2321188 RepID=UPI003C7169DF